MFSRSNSRSSPAIPFGHRVYAIGDIHGEASLLRRVLRLIEEDNGERRDAMVTLVFLGDLIDRGTDAAALLKTFARMNVDHVVVLKGNHEEALIKAYHGDDDVLDAWMPFGAMATLTGFGVTRSEIDSSNVTFAAALRARIDPDLIGWLESLRSAWECGGYYFTHAGIRPGVDLEAQDDADLRWIREPFLSSGRNHGKVIVHGHTVEPGIPALGGNRIGIDTGAHENGVLTALGLEGARQWLLQASVKDGRGAVASDVYAKQSARPGATPDDRLPMPDIAASIASIVAPKPPRPDAPLLLTSSHGVAIAPSSKGMGNRGYVAAGFALVLALFGGAVAVRSNLGRHGAGGVAMPIPDFPGRPDAQLPKIVPTSSSDARSGRKIDERRHPRRMATRPVMVDTSISVAADEASPRLYGKALAKALEEDRATTRRLNLGELSRQQAKRDVR